MEHQVISQELSHRKIQTLYNINYMSSNNRSINTNFIFIAFVAAKTMGPRLGRWDIDGDPPMGSPANAVVGLFMLWWGWLAFNAGSTFGELHCY